MTNKLRNVLLATAAMLVAVSAASAQTQLKVEIPFTFRAAGVVMPAGSYVVTPSNADSRFQLSDADFKNPVLLHSRYANSAPQQWEKSTGGMLEFICTGKVCDLQRIWTGATGAPARGFYIPKDKDQDSMAAEKPVTRVIAGLVK